MSSRHLRLVIVCLILATGAARSSAASVRWYASIEEASTAAREANRPLMIDFWADWCVACRAMEREVSPPDQFARAADPFVLVRIDADRKPDLSRKYKVTALPTLVFTDSYGNELSRYFGFMALKPVAELLRSLPHDMTDFNRLSKVLAADRNNFDALEGMGRNLRAAGLYRASNDYYLKAVQRPEAKADPSAREAMLTEMGANSLEMKEGKRAAGVFQRCLKEFPNSPRKDEWTAGLQEARGIAQGNN